MKQDLIIEVMQKMALHLDNFQMKSSCNQHWNPYCVITK